MTRLFNLIVAAVAAIAASAAIYFLARLLFGVEDTLAKGAASVPLVALPKAYEELEKISAQSAGTKGEGQIRNISQFSIPIYMLILYAVLLCFALLNLGVIWAEIAFYGLGGQNANYNKNAIGFISAPVHMLGLYLIGRWVGSRSPRFGLAVPVVALFIAVSLTLILQALFGVREVVKAIHGVEPAASIEYLTAVLKNSPGLLIALIPIYIGYWRGMKLKLAKYLKYLLDIVPKDTRETLVSLAYDEAQVHLSSRLRTNASLAA
jgi:hypothetical protein